MERDALAELARRGWDAVADRYVERFHDELERKPYDRDLLARFASMIRTDLPVLDLGCGPGYISAHLSKLGILMHGIDLAPEMIRIARERNPDISFEVGNMLDLDPAPNSFGGAVAFYSLINLVREDVPLLLSNLARGLAPGAPVVIASHCGKGELHETEVLGEKIEMVATLFTAEELGGYIREAGLKLDYLDTRSPLPDEYPTLRVYALASAPAQRP